MTGGVEQMRRLPEMVEGKAVYRMSPESFADQAQQLIELRTDFLGDLPATFGTGPACDYPGEGLRPRLTGLRRVHDKAELRARDSNNWATWVVSFPRSSVSEILRNERLFGERAQNHAIRGRV